MNIVAMVLAGGKGTRLELLTKKNAKPAVGFAAKYRIIDFPLSNCANSGINTVGVLTQYESPTLDAYIGNGEKWGLNGVHCLMSSLAPRQTESGMNWYKGTADAITQNIDFIDKADADYVVILSGDHIYKTSYADMVDLHIRAKADVTISVMEVDPKEASRFGIMAVDKNDVITEFQEKPKQPKSNLASMGVYVFSWKVLRKYLKDDEVLPDDVSEHDFGKNIIPTMLNDKKKLQAYRFKGYWRDVGTISSLHEANMDVVTGVMDENMFDFTIGNRIYTEDTYSVPQYIGKNGSITHSIATQGSVILGKADYCVISSDAILEENTVCTRAVIMAGARIKKGAKINNCIIGPNYVVEEGEEVNLNSDKIVLLAK